MLFDGNFINILPKNQRFQVIFLYKKLNKLLNLTILFFDNVNLLSYFMDILMSQKDLAVYDIFCLFFVDTLLIQKKNDLSYFF